MDRNPHWQPTKAADLPVNTKVRYTTLFLHSTGQFAGAPEFGFIKGPGPMPETVMVHWDGLHEHIPVRASNLVPFHTLDRSTLP